MRALEGLGSVLLIALIALAGVIIAPAQLVIRWSRLLACVLVVALISTSVVAEPPLAKSSSLIYGMAILVCLAYPATLPRRDGDEGQHGSPLQQG